MEKKQDILNRQVYVDKLIEIIDCISEKKSSYCFAIDGQWGAGKTYILDMLEEQIKHIQSEESNDDRYFIFNYNCWKYDYYEEPAISIVATMLDKLEEEQLFSEQTGAVMKSSWKKAKKIIGDIAGEFSKNKIGIDLVEIVRDIKDNAEKSLEDKNEFDKLFSFKKTLTHTREKLAELSQEKSILFIVDELDRCLPQYSIKVLERLHHIFDGIDNITVLLSVDSKQLSHSIKKIYGEETDIEKYLKKFINFTLVLDTGEINNQFEEKYKDYLDYFSFNDLDNEDRIFFKELYTKIFYEIDIRTQEKLMIKAKLIHEIILFNSNEILNPALACVEIIWLVFSYRISSHNNLNNSKAYSDNKFKWIPNINKATYAQLKECITTNLENYMKEIQKKATDKKIITGATTQLNIKNNLNGNIFWIFAALYHKIIDKNCSQYHHENVEELELEVNLAKKFESLAKITR